jgi:hypothetical protein
MPKKERQKYHRAWYIAHREEIKAKQLANRDEKRAYDIEYRAAHREKRTEYGRAYRLAHPEECKARYRAYRLAHLKEVKTKIRAWHLKRQQERNFVAILNVLTIGQGENHDRSITQQA